MLDYILSALDVAVFAYNVDEQKYMFISPGVSKVVGYSGEQFKNTPHLLRDIIHPEDKQRVLAELESIPIPGEKSTTFRIILPTKEIQWINAKQIQLIHHETRQTTGISILKNITEDVLYKTDSEEKVWFLSSLINSVGALIFRIDINGNYTYVNEIYCQRLGYSKEDLLGQPVTKVFHPDDIDRLEGLMADAFANPGNVMHFRQRKITSGGDVKWVVVDAIGVEGKEGKNAEIQGVALDITDQEKAKEEITWTKNNLEALINNTDDLIWSIDSYLRYVFANAAFKKWIAENYQMEPIEGMHVNDPGVYPSSIVNSWDGYYKRALSGETFEITYEEYDAETRQPVSFEIAFNPIFNNNGVITGVGCFAHNISERLETQRAILTQNEKLKNIASLSSHELRRPVATLMGLVDIMDKENMDNPQNREVLSHIDVVSKELDEVIRLIVNKAFIEDLL